MEQRQRTLALCACLFLSGVACGEDEIAGLVTTTSPHFSADQRGGKIPALQDLVRDVPAVAADKASIPDDVSDSELIAAVSAAGGVVHIGFKPAVAARTKDSGIFPAMTRVQFAQGRNEVSAFGAETIMSFRGMAGIVARISPELAPIIRRLPMVNYLVPTSKLYPQQSPPPQDTSWGVKRVRAPQAWSPLGFRGVGAHVVILDSGSDYVHRTALNGDGPANQSSYYDCYYTANFSTCNDDTGHGTQVAGIAAARDNAVGVIGIAHRPTTTSTVKICSAERGCATSDLAGALDWVAANGFARQVVNISLGQCQNNTALYEAIVRAKTNGALLIVAAGNTNFIYCPGTTVLYPARYAEVVAVSGTLEDDSFAVPLYNCSVGGSRYGASVDISAPFSAYTMDLHGLYATKCGTSYAAPVVTGVAALIWGKWPSWSADQVRSRLEASVVDLGPAGRDDRFGHGRIDALFAVSDEALLSGLSLSGPSTVYEYDVGTWTVTSQGGTAPITYDWQILVNGGVVYTGTGSSFSYTNRGYWTDGPSFWVGVTAREAGGRTRSTGQSVAVVMCQDPTEPC